MVSLSPRGSEGVEVRALAGYKRLRMADTLIPECIVLWCPLPNAGWGVTHS